MVAHILGGSSHSSQKKKKKDRDRDREREKRNSSKVSSHRSSSSSSHKQASNENHPSCHSSRIDKTNKSTSSIITISSENLIRNPKCITLKQSESIGENCQKLTAVNHFTTDCSDGKLSNIESASTKNVKTDHSFNGLCSLDSNKTHGLSNADENASSNVPTLCDEKLSIEEPKNQIISFDESNNVPDTTTTDIEPSTSAVSSSNRTNATFTLPKPECKAFVPSNSNTLDKKATEAAGIVIKKDYLPSQMKTIKVEKTREDVTRVLSYDDDSSSGKPVAMSAINQDEVIKELEDKNLVDKIGNNIKTELVAHKFMQKANISRNKDHSSSHKIETPEKIKIKTEFSVTTERKYHESGIESKSKQSLIKENSSSNHHRHHSTKSSSSKLSSKSSSRRSSSSSTRECSRCYRRSRIKRINTGVQCHKFSEPFKQIEPTATPLKFTRKLASNMTDSLYSDLKYGRFFHVEVHTNGGASVVHMYQDEIDTLTESELDELTEEFFRVVFSEDENGLAHHVMGIVHDAVGYIPDLLEHLGENYSTLTVKAGVLGRNSDIETSTMAQYYEQVTKNYSHGTFRYGPLHQISLVGKVHEEVGGYFPDLLGRLEENPFLKKVGSRKLAVSFFEIRK